MCGDSRRLFEAGIAAANGLTFEQARSDDHYLRQSRGVDQRVGSLEIGKDGDVALYDGDPFEYTTHCIGVYDGNVVSREVREGTVRDQPGDRIWMYSKGCFL